MTLYLNPQIHLVSRPHGDPGHDNFRLLERTLDSDALIDGEVLVRHHYLSLDPYMRGRMSEEKSYAPPQRLNEVMVGGTVGEVVASRHPQFSVGDPVVGWGGWQAYQQVDARKPGALTKVDTRQVPLSAYLGPVGLPGVTAWYGLNEIIQPRTGQTVVVSAASGAVGSVVGQLAKARGCRAVGIAGGPEKCRHVVEDLGFDACVDYKAHVDFATLTAALASVCPDGVDGVFENVGGRVMDAVMHQANPHARFAVCGLIAGYNGEPMVMTNPRLILTQRLHIEGFIVGEHLDVWAKAMVELGGLVASGAITYRETIAQGLASAPGAFFGLLKGRNLGKQLVKLA